MISAKELLAKGNCKGINCKDCPLNKPNFRCEVCIGDIEFKEVAINKLRKLLKKQEPKERTTTLRKRLEEYEKAHRALWQECKDDLNAMMDNSED